MSFPLLLAFPPTARFLRVLNSELMSGRSKVTSVVYSALNLPIAATASKSYRKMIGELQNPTDTDT